MQTIDDIIYFENIKASELTVPKHKIEANLLAQKLAPIEKEILEHGKGVIVIKNSGNVFVSDFSYELSKKINALIK